MPIMAETTHQSPGKTDAKRGQILQEQKQRKTKTVNRQRETDIAALVRCTRHLKGLLN